MIFREFADRLDPRPSGDDLGGSIPSGVMVTPGVLDAAIAEGLSELPIEAVRARRAACQAYETQLSYVRRLVQGRLDIVQYELARRRSGGDTDLPNLVDHLGEILADAGPPTGADPATVHHLPTGLVPGEVDGELAAELDQNAGSRHLSDPAAMDETELAASSEALVGFERDLSTRRRQILDRIDALQADIVERYRSGEASVDTLLERP